MSLTRCAIDSYLTIHQIKFFHIIYHGNIIKLFKLYHYLYNIAIVHNLYTFLQKIGGLSELTFKHSNSYSRYI